MNADASRNMRLKKPTKPVNDRPARVEHADMRFVLGADGCFVYASSGFAELMGIEALALVTQPASNVLQLVPDDQADDDRAFLGADTAQPVNIADDFVSGIRSGNHTLICGAEGTRIDFQFDRVAGPDGKNYIVASAMSTNGVPQRDDDLHRLVQQVIATTEDHNETLGASAALRAGELRQFLEMSQDMMCTIHPDGGIIRFNPAFGHVLGYSQQDMIGKMFMDFVDIGDKPAVRTALYGACQSNAASPTSVNIECRMTTATGETRWTSWSVRLGGPVLYCLGHDSTEAVRDEQALRRREQQLSEAQALAHMGHWRWDIGMSDIEWSSELYNIFGVTPATFKPSMESISALIHRRDLGRLYQAFQRAIIQQNDYDMDFRVQRTDGTLHIVRCEGRCEMDSEGEVVALYGIMQDITSQREHERDLRDAKEAAEAAYASKSRFLANMSHELRTPLNAIIGFSDLMDKQILGPLGNERYLDYVKSIRESGMHLLDLITDILDMSKIEAGKYELTLQDVNVTQIIRTTVQMMDARAQEGGLTLNCSTPDDDVIIRADRRALKQIMLNLLSNAVKFTDTNGSVSTFLTREDNTAIIRVSDTGIGIPAHKIADVTKPFEQVSNAFTRGHDGSGLGLAITKDLTELHGGTLQIESRLGVGTTVTIRLPAA